MPTATKTPSKKGAEKAWTAAEVLAERQKLILPNTTHYYGANPLMIAKAERQWVWDEGGRKYLDAFAGIVTISVGHCHPEVVKRQQEQLAVFGHSTTLYLYPQIVEFARKLVEKVKPSNPALEVCFFCNSGSEANEMAAMLAKNFTGRHEFLALRHSYHGRTLMGMSLSGQSTWHHTTPYIGGVVHVPANYTYRRPEGTTPSQYARWCADEVSEAVKYSTSGKIAAFIAEPITGVGGLIDPEAEYFPRVYEHVMKAGGLYISDEVQTGVGRTGRKFLGIEQWGVRPDIVTMAKGIGNGFPMSAVITTREIAESVRGKLHINTFGGNPVACVTGSAVLDVIEKEKLSENAHEVGGHLKKKLEGLVEKTPLAGDARGKGLMLGLELVKDKKTKEPAVDETAKVLDLMRERGVLVGRGGMAGNVLRIQPPMCVTKADADQVAAALEESLKQAAK